MHLRVMFVYMLPSHEIVMERMSDMNLFNSHCGRWKVGPPLPYKAIWTFKTAKNGPPDVFKNAHQTSVQL